MEMVTTGTMPLESTLTKEFLLREIERLTHEIKQGQHPLRIAGYEGYDDHDLSLMLAEQTTSRVVAEQRQWLLQQMLTAYERLEAGTYGICEDCHTPIIAERLEALPWATLCVTCQSRRERVNGRGRT
jgi:DnaK suppressor protein